MRLLVLALVVVGCRKEAPPPPSSSPPRPTTIVAAAGAAEPGAGKGRRVPSFVLPLLDVRFGASWVLDGDAFTYDENDDGDLADDPPHPIHGDLALGTRWLRIRDGELYRQEVTVRRGALPLPRGTMTFALVGVGGVFDAPEMFVGLDLDRNGTLDLETLDGPELFHAFERELAIDGQGYAIAIDPHGDRLTLTPLDHPVAPRAPLTTGTPAPDFTVTTLDGHAVRFSSLRGKIVLLDLWSLTCPPCVRALPHLAELRARWQARGFELVGVADASDTPDAVRAALATDAGIQAIDEAVQTLYRVDRFPMYFLVDRDGTILCARCSLDEVETAADRRLHL